MVGVGLLLLGRLGPWYSYSFGGWPCERNHGLLAPASLVAKSCVNNGGILGLWGNRHILLREDFTTIFTTITSRLPLKFVNGRFTSW